LAPFSLFQKEKPDIEHHPLKFIPELHMLEIQMSKYGSTLQREFIQPSNSILTAAFTAT
jgi:hypothetical protein